MENGIAHYVRIASKEEISRGAMGPSVSRADSIDLADIRDYPFGGGRYRRDQGVCVTRPLLPKIDSDGYYR